MQHAIVEGKGVYKVLSGELYPGSFGSWWKAAFQIQEKNQHSSQSESLPVAPVALGFCIYLFSGPCFIPLCSSQTKHWYLNHSRICIHIFWIHPTHSLISLFNRYLLSTYYVQEPVVDIGDAAENKTVPALTELNSVGEVRLYMKNYTHNPSFNIYKCSKGLESPDQTLLIN